MVTNTHPTYKQPEGRICRHMQMKENCGFFVPQLFLIYLQSSQLLFWWLFALLGSEGGAKSYWGQGRGMDLKLKQNNHKSRRLLAFWPYSSGRQPENLLSIYMLSILRRILRYFLKSLSKPVLNTDYLCPVNIILIVLRSPNCI